MEFTFETQGVNNYLVYELDAEEQIDTLSLGMMQNNTIPGICPIVVSQLDAARYFKYNISGKISMKQLFEGAVNQTQVIGIFSDILDTLSRAEEYMMDVKTLLLEEAYIFIDINDYKVEMICVPVQHALEKERSLHEFFKQVMYNARFEESVDTSYVVKIISYLNRAEEFQPEGFKECLDQMKREMARASRPVTMQPQSQMHVEPGATGPIGNVPSQPSDKAMTHNFEEPAAMPVKEGSVEIPMSIPQGKAPSLSESEQNMPQAQSNEKQMSLFYLLCHYSSENMKIYKNQQPVKKEKVKGAKSKKTTGAKAAVPSNVAAPRGNASFAIPGAGPKPVAEPVQVNPKPIVQSDIPVQPGRTMQQNSVKQVPGDFGQTTILSTAQTTVLSQNMSGNPAGPRLVRTSTHETITINKSVFKIGKDRNCADYCILDNSAISRSHAVIVLYNGDYYIEDSNSTNHTYVNGQMLQGGSRVKLESGQRITLANEVFEFFLN